MGWGELFPEPRAECSSQLDRICLMYGWNILVVGAAHSFLWWSGGLARGSSAPDPREPEASTSAGPLPFALCPLQQEAASLGPHPAANSTPHPGVAQVLPQVWLPLHESRAWAPSPSLTHWQGPSWGFPMLHPPTRPSLRESALSYEPPA